MRKWAILNRHDSRVFEPKSYDKTWIEAVNTGRATRTVTDYAGPMQIEDITMNAGYGIGVCDG